MSVTLMHPVKAVGLNEMPFGSDTSVVPCNTVIERGLGPHGKGRFGGSELPVKICIARCCQTVTDTYIHTFIHTFF